MNYYKSPFNINENINILFINGNHYNLLYNRNNDNENICDNTIDINKSKESNTEYLIRQRLIIKETHKI